jgi:hypothetical protein
LKRSLDAISQYAGVEQVGADFKEEVRQLVARLATALQNQIRMTKYRHDPETMAEMYLATADGYKVSPVSHQNTHCRRATPTLF